MNASSVFYICPICFYACEIPDDGHEHALLRVDLGLPGDERRKPITARNGQILSTAPRWFHGAVIQARVAPRHP
ncbi:MAG TPA: hypothetical protein VN843_15745 [Anaerolineales bacterium]|nr:hypothetical protein [Anaerolineales bacterium]